MVPLGSRNMLPIYIYIYMYMFVFRLFKVNIGQPSRGTGHDLKGATLEPLQKSLDTLGKVVKFVFQQETGLWQRSDVWRPRLKDSDTHAHEEVGDGRKCSNLCKTAFFAFSRRSQHTVNLTLILFSFFFFFSLFIYYILIIAIIIIFHILDFEIESPATGGSCKTAVALPGANTE